MSKFLNKRHKYQSTREVDRRESKALAEAEAKHELLGIESLRESNPRMRKYFMEGDFYDPRRGYFFVNELGIAAARRQPPGGHDDWFGGEPVEIPAYAMDLLTRRPGILRKQFVATGFEEEFAARGVVSVIDSYSPGLDETLGWGGPRSLNISSIESMGTYSPKGVEVRVVGDGEFTDEEPVCPHCGGRHRSFGMDGLVGFYFKSLLDRMRKSRAIDGEFHHVQENNLLTHDPKDPE